LKIILITLVFIITSLFVTTQMNIFAATGKFTLNVNKIFISMKRNLLIFLSVWILVKLIPLETSFMIENTH